MSGGDGLRILGKGLRGSLAGSFSGDAVGVLPDLTFAAGKRCFGGCGGSGFLGPADGATNIVINKCKYLTEDRS